MLREQVPGPVQGAGGGFIAGDDERHQLVEQFIIAEPVTVFVPRGQIARQEIVILDRLGASPVLNDFQQQIPQISYFQNDLQVARRILAQKRERVFAFAHDFAVVVRAENGTQDQLERKVTRLLRDIDLPIAPRDVPPTIEPRFTALHHQFNQAVQVLPAECRLDHRSRASPGLTVTDDQAVAEQHLHSFESRALAIPVMTLDEELADLRGVVDEQGITAIRFLHQNDVAVIFAKPEQEFEGFRVDTGRQGSVGPRWPPHFRSR